MFVQTIGSADHEYYRSPLVVPAIEFGKLGDKALLIESKFKDLDVDISGYFILIPTLESYGQILTSLGL